MRTALPVTAADLRELVHCVPSVQESFDVLDVTIHGPACLGEAIAIRWAGRLLGCGGVVPQWPGVVSGWLVLTPEASRHVTATYRAVRAFLIDYVLKHGTWRIECSIHTTTPSAAVMAEMLGMAREGVRRRYLPDKRDAWLYAWVREDP